MNRRDADSSIDHNTAAQGRANETYNAMTSLAPEWDEWLSLFANRNEVAVEYARMMRQHSPGWSEWEGFRMCNEAILRRWSPAGLRYIKERAWKIATQNL